MLLGGHLTDAERGTTISGAWAGYANGFEPCQPPKAGLGERQKRLNKLAMNVGRQMLDPANLKYHAATQSHCYHREPGITSKALGLHRRLILNLSFDQQT